MKISDVEVIRFLVPRKPFDPRVEQPVRQIIQTIVRIRTDEGAQGLCLGGHGHGDQDGLSPEEAQAVMDRGRSILIGQDPFDREKFWHWMWVSKTPEHILSVIDLALWDLQARLLGAPVYKLLGGCREKVKAYASTYPNMGSPQEYADHAVACARRGYRAYKIHPYYFADPQTLQPMPGRPSHIDEDIEVCRAVRSAVGDRMVLMFDPWGTYCTYEEALRVGRELERLGFYWYEHPMPEYGCAAMRSSPGSWTSPSCPPRSRRGASTPARTGSCGTPLTCRASTCCAAGSPA